MSIIQRIITRDSAKKIVRLSGRMTSAAGDRRGTWGLLCRCVEKTRFVLTESSPDVIIVVSEPKSLNKEAIFDSNGKEETTEEKSEKYVVAAVFADPAGCCVFANILYKA